MGLFEAANSLLEEIVDDRELVADVDNEVGGDCTGRNAELILFDCGSPLQILMDKSICRVESSVVLLPRGASSARRPD